MDATDLLNTESASSLLNAEPSEVENPSLKKEGGKYQLKEYSSLPDYLRDNEFILRGYRVNFPIFQAILSVLRIHNETGNIWTHLIGFLVFLALTIYTAASWPKLGGMPAIPTFQNLSSLPGLSLPYFQALGNLSSLSKIEFRTLSSFQSAVPNLHVPDSLASCFVHRNKTSKADAARCIFANLPKLRFARSVKSCFSPSVFYSSDNSSHSTMLNTLKHIHLPDYLSACFKSNSEASVKETPEDQCMFAALWMFVQTSFLHMPESLTSCFNSAESAFNVGKDYEKCLFQTMSEDMAAALELFVRQAQGTPPVTRWPMIIFLTGAMICLLTSTTCHMLGCHSKRLNDILWRFDYAGIAALITASFFPPVYYGFLCEPLFRTIYLVSISVIGVAAVLVSLLDFFQKPSFRPVRAAIYFGMGFCGILPTLHKLLTTWNERVIVVTTLYIALMGLLYGVGALFYATRVPERWLPGVFDFAGHSHQIFHVLVVAGALTHYMAGLEYLKWRDSSSCSRA